MKLIFIYGPPAVGKLTVAKELAKITRFKLFHNHLVNDMLDNIVDSKKESDLYWELSDELKLRIIEKLAKHKLKNIIFTMMRAKNPKDHDLPNKIKNVVKKHKGKIYFVKLECDDEEVLKRVNSASRKKFGKFSSKKAVKKFIKEYDPHAPLRFKNQLIINNTKLSPKKVARFRYHLQKQQDSSKAKPDISFLAEGALSNLFWPKESHASQDSYLQCQNETSKQLPLPHTHFCPTSFPIDLYFLF